MADRPLDRIHIRDLLVRCIVGIRDWERAKKQDVVLNVTLHADLERACASDAIDDTVDYVAIKQSVIETVEGSSFHLVERLAQAVADVCLQDERVQRVDVLLEKPGALRFARTVAVEITRERGG
jgi:dihydroneopterin aldolase/D-erythro-7,8-dihydroneopterin triphosphate epimerase